jgi:cytochrome d ubiquinol oxidase subunit II
MDLPLLSAVFAAFSITMYVLLDGFDLGVGALLLLQPHEASRNHMVDSITPTWDGNETWLIMTGVTLLAGFPLAYSILMPAFYVPLIVMLLALGLRGVSFEFTIRGGAFGGSVFDCLRPFPFLCAACVLAGYIVLGGCWLYLKTPEATRHCAERALRLALPAFFILFSLACFTAAIRQPEVRAAWKVHTVSMATIVGMMALAASSLFVSIGKRSELRPFVAAVSMVGLGIAGLAVLIFPDIVPFRLSLWEASASRLSHIFLLSGAVFVTPLVLAYSAFAYWVFRGKTPRKGWEL